MYIDIKTMDWLARRDTALIDASDVSDGSDSSDGQTPNNQIESKHRLI